MSRSPFPALRVAGGLLPADLFGRVLEGRDLPGWDPADYGLAPHENVRQAATRAFDYLGGAWQAFIRERDKAQAEGRPLTGLTRERWLHTVFRALDYGILSTTPAGGLVVEDKTFRVSHLWEHVPIHLLGWGVDLDRRTKGVAGAAEAAPQSMVQELLNCTEEHLWAIVSNGCTVRLLRDSRSLAGSAYVEFDLELIFNEQLFPDFVLLFRLLHASRLAVPSEETPAACWLEHWRVDAVKQGERALERLSDGVERAITTLGTGFLRHPANSELRTRLATGTLTRDDYKRAVLRLVYRLLFWFVAEDRDVLLDPDGPTAARARYAKFFSAQRLRDRARSGSTDHHEDLWEAVRLVFTGLGTEQGRPELSVPGLGGLFERITRDQDDEPIEPTRPDALDEPLEELLLTNEALITAVRHLTIVESDSQRRPVDFRNLDSEELGSVYESLLELHPQYDPQEQTFTLVSAAGNERKETGSYYTPTSLTEALLDSALDPVLNDAAQTPGDAETKVAALLGVTVCDPACGSGHFLVAAARRIARRVAQLRSGEHEPSPDLVRTAMREVVSRCIHGVDINEMAAELAKVSLWLESVEPGKPLAFLDANIRVGNSLLGTTPALIAAGIPDDAFAPIEGDNRAAAKTIRERSARENAGQVYDLFSSGGLELTNKSLAVRTREVVHSLPIRLSDVIVARRRLRRIDGERSGLRRLADAWCAAFVQEKTPDMVLSAITEGALKWINTGATSLSEEQIIERVERLARDYRFFHWHAEFPHVFTILNDEDVDAATGWRGGFSCVIGNPPWERVKLQEKEFFASRSEEIAKAGKVERERLIRKLKSSETGHVLDRQFHAAQRRRDGEAHFFRASQQYPLTTGRTLNTYALFTERATLITTKTGRCGLIVKTGIATDFSNMKFFNWAVSAGRLISLFDFENRRKIFREVHSSERFCLITLSGSQGAPTAQYAFMLHEPAELANADNRYLLNADEVRLLNPNTGTCPVFRSRRDARLTIHIYQNSEHLERENADGGNSWGVKLARMFHSSDDEDLFEDINDLQAEGWQRANNEFSDGVNRKFPLYEAKMVNIFNHRAADIAISSSALFRPGQPSPLTDLERNDPSRYAKPRYLVSEKEAIAKISPAWKQGWLPAWRDVTSATNERTLLPVALPLCACVDTILLCYPLAAPNRAHLLLANLSTFVIDYVVRQKVSGAHVKYHHLRQLPVVPVSRYDKPTPWDAAILLSDWSHSRVLELYYTSYDMMSFAWNYGDTDGPFRWDVERRFRLRAELDAAYFHLHGLPRDDVGYVMDTFRAFRNNDPDRFARTKKTILDIYDAMANAIRTGDPYRSVLNPPPGHGPRHPLDPVQ